MERTMRAYLYSNMYAKLDDPSLSIQFAILYFVMATASHANTFNRCIQIHTQECTKWVFNVGLETMTD